MKERIQLIREELLRVDGQVPEANLPKHRKMASNPFVFLRGSAQLFYADLASGFLNLPKSLNKLPLTTVMGDCHTSNFGFLSEEGSHGDSIIFSPNDFDDACTGHASWDLSRFATSLALCADYAQGVADGRYTSESDMSGKAVISSEDIRPAIEQFLRAYLEVCEAGIDQPDNRRKTITGFKKSHVLHKRYQKALNRACGGTEFETRSSLAKAVDTERSVLRFRNIPARFRRVGKQSYQKLEQAFAPYMDDCILDITERLNAGTGSVNMGRYYFLIGPAGYRGKKDLGLCHIVEVKQQRHAAPLYHFPDLSPVNRLNPAHLTVNCQYRMQRRPDLVLDEAIWQGNHWLIRSRHHARVGIDPEHITFGKKAVNGGFIQYAATCGEALALAHCRGDRRSIQFEKAVAKYLPDAIEGLIEATLNYADVVKKDCETLNKLLTH
ncbi:DUF2252 family protein [Oceanospirillum sediminis]|uniref:DUF2252 family protein n=1 Tax=Oceanospirillum sediminis TaxID=2760088 RepID=A0A839IVR0_9GAMM|nr:DUF2252 family protein [Oceanospirillum sediminis]MBB1489038.1 DUF2252 family protein [Oceanospirillum sediminis]